MLIRQITEAYPTIKAKTRSLAQPQAQVQPQANIAVIRSLPGASAVVQAAEQAGIQGIELAQFIAQLKHESWNFTRLSEVPKGKNYYNRYDPRHNPRQARSLGNRRPGDGERYKGRGYIQLTGRENYDRAGRALGINLLQQPELASRPDVAARIAVWYWFNRVKPYVQDWMDTERVTKLINPALKGLADRQRNFELLLR